MQSLDALKRMPKFKRCKITTDQLYVLMHNFGEPPLACRAAPAIIARRNASHSPFCTAPRLLSQMKTRFRVLRSVRSSPTSST